jgi:hypothetical protein
MDGRLNLVAVDLPDIRGAIAPQPQQVAVGVAGEIVDARQMPFGAVVRDRRDELGGHSVGHLPQLHVIVGIDPDNVGRSGVGGLTQSAAAVIEVAHSGDVPFRPDLPHIRGRHDIGAVQRPALQVTAGVFPENGIAAGPIKVADRRDMPLGADLTVAQDRRVEAEAVQRPDVHVPAGVSPQHVGIAVAVEIAEPLDVPFRAHMPGQNGGSRNRGSIELPDGDLSAAAVAPDELPGAGMIVPDADRAPFRPVVSIDLHFRKRGAAIRPQHRAALVGPENVGLAVAVEIVRADEVQHVGEVDGRGVACRQRAAEAGIAVVIDRERQRGAVTRDGAVGEGDGACAIGVE